MLDAYYSYWNTGTYRKGSVLKAKLLLSHENGEFSQIEGNRVLSLPFYKKTLKRKGPKIAAILDFLLPVETCFWVVHFAYAFVNKRRFK